MKKSYKKARNPIFEYLGWLGVALLLADYIALSAGIISGTSYLYQFTALAGCIGIAVEAWHKKDRQPLVLNIIFAFIAIFAIVRIMLLD